MIGLAMAGGPMNRTYVFMAVALAGVTVIADIIGRRSRVPNTARLIGIGVRITACLTIASLLAAVSLAR